jgi:putative peptidoglycan lipid II flippase
MTLRSPFRPQGDGLGGVLGALLPVNLAVQIFNFVALIVFARILGATADTDAYFVGLAVPLFTYGLLLAALRTGAIPALTEAAAEGEEAFDRAASQLVSGVLLASVAVSAVVTLIAFAFAPVVLGGNAHFIALARRTMVELSPLGVAGAVTGALGAVLAVRRRFVAAVAVMALEPILKTIAVASLGHRIGIHAMVLGNVVGSCATALILIALAVRAGVRIRPASPLRSPFVRSVLVLSTPLLIGGTVLQVNPVVDRAMATGLGAGKVTALELGFRLVPTAMFAAVLIGPVTATWAARVQQGGWPALQASIDRAIGAIITVLPTIVVAGLLLRHQLVAVLYAGGAYPERALRDSSAVFGMLLLGLPAQVLSVVFATLFSVQKNTLVPMKIACANVLLNVVLNLAFRPVFGVAGIALSTSLTYVILVAVYARAATKRWGALTPGVTRATIARSGAWALAVGGVAATAALLAPSSGARLESVAVLLVVGATGAAVGAAIFGVPRRIGVRAIGRSRLTVGEGL